MKTLCLAVTIALSSATAAALHAQTSTTSKPTTVTVSGCVERATADTPTGTSGTAGAATRETKFVLTTPSVAATAGTSGGSRASVAYRLDDADQTKVAPHEGQKVEIAGTVEDRGSQSSERQTEAAAGSAARAPVLRVESIRMIASTCAG